MAQPWSKAEKPWDKETTRQRYVLGEKISYEELAIESGMSYQSIVIWASTDKKRGDSWPAARQNHIKKLRAKTAEKTLEETSTLLAKDYAQDLARHYRTSRMFCDLAEEAAKVHTILLAERTAEYEASEGEAKTKAINDASKLLLGIAKDVSLWMGIADRAIGREREALEMDAHSVNTALKTVTAAGFEVKNVTQEAMKAALEAEGFKVEKVEEEDGD